MSEGKHIQRRSGPRGRGLRRSAENKPGSDYLRRLEQLGPREGESYLAFRMRLAAVREGRKILLDAAKRNCGNVSDVCREVGVHVCNLTTHYKTLGLTKADLTAFAPEYRTKD